MKVFLGGTCNSSKWRDIFLNDKKSKELGIEYFDPVVKDWTEECQKREIYERENCDFCLYVITPLMTGVYSIAEATEDSIKRPKKTLFCFINEDSNVSNLGAKMEYVFSTHQVKSLKQVGELIQKNGGMNFSKPEFVLSYLYTQI
jgi:hypothetical protein